MNWDYQIPLRIDKSDKFYIMENELILINYN